MTATAAQPRRPSFARRTWMRVRLLKESPIGMVGAFLVTFWVLVAIFAPWIAPHDPNESNMDALIDPTPTAVNWLGTDNQGRDILSRIIWGSRTVLAVAPLDEFTLEDFDRTLASQRAQRVRRRPGRGPARWTPT